MIGNDHDRQDDSGREHAECRRAARRIDRVQPRVFAEERLDVLRQKRHQNKDRPQPIDHAGNRGQQFHKERERTAQCLGAHFRRENGNPDGQRNRNDQCNSRRNQRAVDEWQRPELFVDRVPIACGKEFETKGMPGETGARHQFVNNQNQHNQHRETASGHGGLENTIGNFASRSLLQGRGPVLRRLL